MFKRPAWQDEKLPEPEDFPEATEAPGLRVLDGALRCTICKEFFTGPVSLRCGHSFCSQCIRESLAVKQECPTCRKGQENEGHIRVNPALEEAVAAWGEARASILSFIEKANRPAMVSNTSSPKKRKRSAPDTDSSDVEIVSTPPRASSSKLKQTICPICNKPATEDVVNQHLDNGCDTTKDGKNTKDAWAKMMAPKPSKGKGKAKSSMSDTEEDSPLPKVSYATMKDKQIKELLAEQGLPTVGDRQSLIKQHQQWVIIYNANLDQSAKRRKTIPQLKQELARWTKSQQTKSKPVVDNVAVHQRKYHGEFAKLTEAARPRDKSSAASQSPVETNAVPLSSNNPPLPVREDEIIAVH